MNHIENKKDNNKIDAEVLFRCSGDLMDSIEKQSRATREVNNSLNNLNSKIDNLEKAFTESSKSSGRVSLALNILTGVLAVIAAAQLFVTYIK